MKKKQNEANSHLNLCKLLAEVSVHTMAKHKYFYTLFVELPGNACTTIQNCHQRIAYINLLKATQTHTRGTNNCV